ncbi:MAG: FAD-dependent oxidoreductase [Bdellovibrionales bacterium]|nr:FAD-dependent oxidoreductase [Bdellovibrionales bacterium]
MTYDIIMIGAGVAGLAAASELQSQGKKVLVIDKGRGVGGRMATRRVGPLRMDHGAQFITLRDSRFESKIAPLLTSGELFPWSHGFPLWRDGSISPRPDGHPRFALRSGMSALPKFLAQGLEILLGDAATAVSREGVDEWQVELAGGARHCAKTLLINMPPAQLLPLVGDFLDVETRQKISVIEMDPTWVVFGEVDQDPDFGGVALEFEGHPVLRFIARDHTRRSPGHSPALVVHCHERWSRENLEATATTVVSIVSQELERLFQVRFKSEPEVHRWKFATPLTSLGELCLWSPELRLGACGDWCAGGRVEGAVLSGWELAKKALCTPLL